MNYTPEVRQRVVTWLNEQMRANPQSRIRWEDIARFSGFSRVRLSKDPETADAYQRVREAWRAARRGNAGPSKKEGALQIRILRLEEELKQFKAEREKWLSLWDRWQYNAHRMGWKATELDRPLPRPRHRKRKNGKTAGWTYAHG